MSEPKDPRGYYKTLNISPKSDSKAIKIAYNKLQKMYNSSSVGRKTMRQSEEYKKMSEEQKKAKEEEMDEICMKLNEAYNILGNPEKKKQYDEGTGEFAPKFEGFNMGDGDFPFSEFFVDFANNNRNERKQKYKVVDTVTEINVTMKEAFTGKKCKFRIKIKKKCAVCDGKGAAELKKCSKCNGRGSFYVKRQGILTPYTEMECDACGGEGEMAASSICAECQGSKVITVSEIIELDIPAGAQDGQKIVFRERGNQFRNCRNGDIVFVVKIQADSRFSRVNNDIVAITEIDILSVLTGGIISFEHLDGRKLSVHVPPFKSFDKAICITGEGFKNGNNAGDLYLKPNIIINPGLTRDKLSEYLRPLVVHRPSSDSKDVHSVLKNLVSANKEHKNNQDGSEYYKDFSKNDFFKGFRFF